MPKSIIFSLLALLTIAGFLYFSKFFSSKPQTDLPVVKIKIKEQNYNLEVAKTSLEHSRGLSGRTSLCPDCGMIFVFDSPNIYPFWMKNTLIPLDMIWLDQTGRVVTIHTASPEPGIADLQLKRYANDIPARYVIELNASDSAKLNLSVGDFIDLNSLNEN